MFSLIRQKNLYFIKTFNKPHKNFTATQPSGSAMQRKVTMYTLHLIKKRTKLPASSCRTGNNEVNNFSCGCYHPSKIWIGNLSTKAFLVNYAVILHDWMANFLFNKCKKNTVLSNHGSGTICRNSKYFLNIICLFSKWLINFSSLSAPFVAPYIGLSSTTLPAHCRQYNIARWLLNEEYHWYPRFHQEQH